MIKKLTEQIIKNKQKSNNTNPISKKLVNNLYNDLLNEVNELESKPKAEIESGLIQLVDKISNLDLVELKLLMIHESELVRNVVAKAFVDKNETDLNATLNKLSNSKNLYLRHSAVIALSYNNIIENAEPLKTLANDSSDMIRFTAIAGLVDLAIEYQDNSIKEHLKQFLNDKNEEIKSFIEDEISLF